MLRSLKDLETYSIHALDGDLGKLDQLFFDDDHWLVRYLVVKTGRFFHRAKILISTHGLKKIDWPSHRFEVSLTRDQIERSPEIEIDQPPPRLKEIEYFNYYRWPYYWTNSGIWGVAPIEVIPSELNKADPHLRSTQSALECKVQTGGTALLGRVVDLLIDDDRWTVKYLVIDTGTFRDSKMLLIPTDQVTEIDWASRSISLDLSLDFFAGSPVYYPMAPHSRDFEQRMRDYYQKVKKVS